MSAILLAFERGYERIGMPAPTLVTLKLGLLAATVLAAIDARLRLIPACGSGAAVSRCGTGAGADAAIG